MRRRILIYSGITIVISGLWLSLIYLPYHRGKAEAKAEVQRAQIKLTEFERIRVELPAYISASNKLRNVRSHIESRLYAKGNILALFDHLSRTIEGHRLELVEIKPSLEELLQLNERISNTNELLFINVGLVVEGRFVNLGRFVEALEEMPFVRGINDCLIARSVPSGSRVLRSTIGFKALLGNLGTES